MKHIIITFLSFFILVGCCSNEELRRTTSLNDNWYFTKGDVEGASALNFDHTSWEKVTVPHDWAIYGPFDRANDLQFVAVSQNFETQATAKTGRTGGLPYVGVGWYRRTFDTKNIDLSNERVTLYFDGVMSEATVYVNGEVVAFWALGYNAFYCDVTDKLNTNGVNTLAVRVENLPQSSRWYPGAGIYRDVDMIVTSNVHIPVWGTYLTTPQVNSSEATVNIKTTVKNSSKSEARDIALLTEIFDSKGKRVARNSTDSFLVVDSLIAQQNIQLLNPELWSPETPTLYKAVTTVIQDGKAIDSYTTRFGVRTIEVVAEKGFYLNGKNRKFQGVCLHHDLGPLGAAINRAAIRRQLTMLKDMGCDAIRTSHNMPASAFVELCDEMGFMVMVEPFDEWDVAKCKNGYHRFFDEWAERDMVNMLRHFRNNASVVMWSIGNEVPTQCSKEGASVAKFLQDICHREDPTRPVTCGMDQVSCVLENGFAAVLDLPGLNYRTFRYEEAYNDLPHKMVLGSETASTVSSRGVYKFPAIQKPDAVYEDNQSSSYDLEYCSWSNIPDEDFALADDYDWTMGQFVWTGFDYLGEPSPYDTDAWPSHSSYFGIIDLASIPKDRYYYYRSLWNKNDNTLHMLPHWNWSGREGEITPVFVYTSYPEAELFVNGRSQGKRSKNNNSLLERYRLMWNEVVYEPGEIVVVAYDSAGVEAGRKSIKTASEAKKIVLTADRSLLNAKESDLSYINVQLVDSEGNFCPTEDRTISVKVKGAGKFRAMANGDPTSLEMFHTPQMRLFSGQLTVLVETIGRIGDIEVEISATGLEPTLLILEAK